MSTVRTGQQDVRELVGVGAEKWPASTSERVNTQPWRQEVNKRTEESETNESQDK